MGKQVFTFLKNLAAISLKGVNYQKQLTLEKKLGYNHGNILVHEEQSIASKIIKLFSNEKNITRQKSQGQKAKYVFVNCKVIIEIDVGDHIRYDSDNEKERQYTLKELDCVTV